LAILTPACSNTLPLSRVHSTTLVHSFLLLLDHSKAAEIGNWRRHAQPLIVTQKSCATLTCHSELLLKRVGAVKLFSQGTLLVQYRYSNDGNLRVLPVLPGNAHSRPNILSIQHAPPFITIRDSRFPKLQLWLPYSWPFKNSSDAFVLR